MSIAIKRNFTIPSTSAIGATELYLTSSVASTTIGTGALQVAGGAEANASQYASCQVSSFNMYNRALSAQEILQNYNSIKKRYGL
jgi:hypothetical protein